MFSVFLVQKGLAKIEDQQISYAQAIQESKTECYKRFC